MTQRKDLFDKQFWLFVAQGFGSGRAPWFPGTCGTVVGVFIYFLINWLPLSYYVMIVFALTLFGFWLCEMASRELGHDHPSIVWDEIVGFLWVMVAIPHSWEWVLAAFILFRIFDMWKPKPIDWADQHLKGGAGVMVDDMIAALYAWIGLQVLMLL